jgi:hypothetical protein
LDKEVTSKEGRKEGRKAGLLTRRKEGRKAGCCDRRKKGRKVRRKVELFSGGEGFEQGGRGGRKEGSWLRSLLFPPLPLTTEPWWLKGLGRIVI